jgi:hypothetical protein
MLCLLALASAQFVHPASAHPACSHLCLLLPLPPCSPCITLLTQACSPCLCSACLCSPYLCSPCLCHPASAHITTFAFPLASPPLLRLPPLVTLVAPPSACPCLALPPLCFPCLVRPCLCLPQLSSSLPLLTSPFFALAPASAYLTFLPTLLTAPSLFCPPLPCLALPSLP